MHHLFLATIIATLLLCCPYTRAALLRCPAPSPEDILPPTICCNNVTQLCNLTSSFVTAFTINVSSIPNATLQIGAKQTFSLGGVYAEGQPSFFAGSVEVGVNGTLWVGRVAFHVGGTHLTFASGSTLRITGNGTIVLSPWTCLSIGKNVTLILDLDNNETASVPILQTASNESALCFSQASEASTFDPINASYTLVNAQSGTIEIVWQSLGTGCNSYSSLSAVFTSGGCSPPPAPRPPITTTVRTPSGGVEVIPLAEEPVQTINGLWAIGGSVMGGVVLMLITACLLFAYNPRFRRCLAPFRDRVHFVPSIMVRPQRRDRKGETS